MKKKHVAQVLVYFAVIVVVIWTLAPIAWMYISSIIPGKEMLSSSGSIIPSEFTQERYGAIIFGKEIESSGISMTEQAQVFRKAVLNSIIVAGSTTLISLFFGALAAYAFARLKFKGKNLMLFTALFFQLLPPIALLIPYYLMASSSVMLDKLPTLIIVNTNTVLAYVIWVLNGYFRSIPAELENAARIDGCSWFSAFFRIIVPTAKPGFVAVGALSFLMAWDEFLYALIFTKSSAAKTIPVAVSEFGTRFGVDYGMMMTAGMIATLFPLILSLFFQKYIVSGLTAGAVKQ